MKKKFTGKNKTYSKDISITYKGTMKFKGQKIVKSNVYIKIIQVIHKIKWRIFWHIHKIWGDIKRVVLLECVHTQSTNYYRLLYM